MTWRKISGAAALSVLALVILGCGTPGQPLPPSLNLPNPVGDLAAVRTGNQVALSWTMPRRNTDKLPLKKPVTAYICRSEGNAPCGVLGQVTLAPGAAGSYSETLPPALAGGVPRPLRYFVELKNRNGRSAGMSDAAVVLAGEAPAPVAGLAAELHRNGVVLHWAEASQSYSIRLQRTLVSATKAVAKKELLQEEPEPARQNLLIEKDAGRALDGGATVGQAYEYTAQRLSRVEVDGKALELAGAVSAPLRVEVRDIFPPAAPTGLVAVATAPDAGAQAAIDLNWQPNSENDLAGYFVYRREGEGPWQRISPAQPQVASAFHDAQVQPGHAYSYAVTAVDRTGHESPRSAETSETAPQS